MIHFLSGMFILVLAVTGCAERPPVVTPADLEAALHDAAANGPPGVSAVIATRHGIVWSGSDGFADLEKGVPASPRHRFGVGSITKTFVAVVALQLIDEGRLSLDATPADILGDTVRHVPNADRATVATLLNHTSGIPSFEDDADWIRHGRGALLDVERIWGKTDALDFVAGDGAQALFEPGERFSYSNSNHTLLGLMIEHVTGTELTAEIRRRILAPLDVAAIFLEGFEAVPEGGPVAKRYHYATEAFARDAGVHSAFPPAGDGLIDVSRSNLSVEWAAGGMVAAAGDLAAYALGLRDGRLLPPDMQQTLYDWRQIREEPSPVWVGHGLFRTSLPTGVMIGHSGSVLGYTAYMGWYEDSDLVVVVLANAGSMHVGGGVVTASGIAQRSEFARLAHAFGIQHGTP